MSEATTDDIREEYLQQFTTGDASRAAPRFDAWLRKERAKAWDEGADFGYDACANGEEEKHNPYKEA